MLQHIFSTSGKSHGIQCNKKKKNIKKGIQTWCIFASYRIGDGCPINLNKDNVENSLCENVKPRSYYKCFS